MKRFLLLVLLLTGPAALLFATHNRAGEIYFKCLDSSGLRYKITVITYTKTSSPADRPTLEIFWGDGKSDSLLRLSKTSVSADISLNKYEGEHTYAGNGFYTISLEDPNRNGSIVNIPNSVNVPFYIETILFISPFGGVNSSPVLLEPPIDKGCTNRIFIHNPGAYDPDGDSLSYRLVNCKAQGGTDIWGYSIPGGVTIDPTGGDLVWNTPQAPGEYNFAILIEEWRNGVNIGSMIRDLQVTIEDCTNNPPVIAPMKDTCVEAGQFISIPVSASDPDSDPISLTASGAPFQVNSSPAVFTVNGIMPAPQLTAQLQWQTNCSHVRRSPYQAVIKAKESGTDENLADFKSVYITVVGPAPKNPSAQPSGNSIKVTWNRSACSNASCYKIYRRNGSQPWTPSYCETGVPGYLGYTLVGTTNSLTDTTFTDDNGGEGLVNGIYYCYRIVACYPDGAESYSSVETCAVLKKDLPVITNVSVNITHASAGEMYLAWSKPTELDTVQYPPPYRYLIYRAAGFASTVFTLIDSTGMANGLNDTIYTDTKALNTQDLPYVYRVELYADANAGRLYVGKSQKASSVYLNIAPTDNRLNLSWQEYVPWGNYSYVIYRFNTAASSWDSIGTTSINTFSDSLLLNGVQYCYKIKSIGSYSAAGFINPILNFSEEKCAVPVDNVKPCGPAIIIQPDCIKGENLLAWVHPNNKCADDVLQFNIYYAATDNGAMELLVTLKDTFYLHKGLSSIAGCYIVTSVDSAGNESEGGAKVCVDNCPQYTIPNVFTPDNDGVNEKLVPFPYRHIRDIDIKIYNRWGQQVYQTSDPDINWDGRNQSTGAACPDGVYYYVCDVHEIRLTGIQTVTYWGFVHLLRNQ